MFSFIKKQISDARTLVTFTGLRTLGQAMGMIAPLVIAKFFSPELFASYCLAKMIIFFFVSVLIASSQTPFIVFANQQREKTGKINKAFSVESVFLSLSLIIFALITLVFGKYLARFARIDYSDLFFVFLAFLGLSAQYFLSNLFMALNQRLKYSLVELVFGFSSLVLIFVFFLIGWINLRSALLIYFFSSLVLIAVFTRTIDRKILFPFQLEKKCFLEMFDFTKWVFLGATAVYFINWGDNLVLRYFVPMADIGVYNLAYQIFKATMILFSVIGVYFLPFIIQNISNPAKVNEYLYSKRPKILLVGLIVIILAFFIVPAALKLIYGQVYQDSIVVIRILLIASVMYLYTIFYVPVFNALKRYKFIHIVNVIQILLNLGLNIILVPRYGISGAAIATVTAYIFHAAIVALYFQLKLKKLFTTTVRT